MGLFSSAPQALVGIDIGSDSIKAVELAGSYRSGFRLVHMGVAPSPPVAMRDGVPTAPEELGSHVRALLDRTGIKLDRAVMGVGGQAVTVREIRVPPMTKQELAAAVRYEAERYLPYNIKEVYMDFQVLGETTEDGRRMLDVIVVAARQDVVDQIIAVAEAARVQLRVLDVESFALLRSVIPAAGDGQTTAIVDLGAEASDILITEGPRLRFTRNIPIGGGVLLGAIHEAMDVDLATAKSLLEEKGEVLEEGATSPDHTTERIHDIIAPHIGDLVTEIRRSLDYYQTRSRAAVVNQILLAGGLARLRNLDRTIAAELGIATTVASPFVNVRVNPQAFPADRLAAGSTMAVAVGLAMRGGDVS